MGNGQQRCQACGALAPTRYVDFRQNVGMLVARRSKTVAGQLCKPCVHQHFWKMTGTTLAVGWLGRISAFMTPVYVVNNVIRYVSVLGMPGPGKLTKAAAEDALPVMTYAPPPRGSSAPIPFDPDPAAEPIDLLAEQDPGLVLRHHWVEMVGRIKAKEPLEAVAADVAGRTGLRAGQVSEYVRSRVQRAKAAKDAATGRSAVAV